MLSLFGYDARGDYERIVNEMPGRRINAAVPDEELHAATQDLLARATRGSVASKALGKRGFYAQVGMEQSQAYEFAVAMMANAAVTPDAQEGIAAFLAKRKPSFTQRP